MMSFRNNRIGKLALPPGTVWLLSEIAEAKGRQDLFTKQIPQFLKALREMALIQSVESSNRIEGISVDPGRLRPLVIGKSRPKDRSEEEIQGYRRALDLIHGQPGELQIVPKTILRLHEICQQGSGDAGQWKRVDNDIVKLQVDRAPEVIFRTVTAKGTVKAVNELCLSYKILVEEQKTHPLVLAAGFILDFLCIHPFRDGNGRVSRLLTLLVFYHHSFEVGRYISLERLVEESKEHYYTVLNESSGGWYGGQNDLLPWLNYFLTILRRAYREFEERAGDVKSPRGAKTTLVVSAINNLADEFTVQELLRKCHGVSHDMVRRVLKDLQKAGKVKCLGRGPGAPWRRKG